MSSLEKLTKLNDICLFVDDFWGSLNYYVEKFGFRIIRLQPDPEHANYAEFDFNGTGVTLWPPWATTWASTATTSCWR